MANRTLPQEEIEQRLVDAGLAWRSGDTIVGERALLATSAFGAYLVFPMSDDSDMKQRLKDQAETLFADAANVEIQEPIGAPRPQ